MALRLSWLFVMCLVGVPLSNAGSMMSNLKGMARTNLQELVLSRETNKRDGTETEVMNILGELLDEVWKLFKTTHVKEYKAAEEALRQGNWLDIVETVLVHNLEADLGIHSFTMGVNQLSDLTIEEVIEKYTGIKEPTNGKRFFGKRQTMDFKDQDYYPDYLNYIEEGAVTAVKNQGQCGSCYAFSAAAAMEGTLFYANNGVLRNVSVQNILDCGANFGCDGGWMYDVWDWIIKNGGIDGWQCYGRDYLEKVGPDCKYTTSNECWLGTLGGFYHLPTGDEVALAKATYVMGPVSVAICVTSSFQNYKSGVYDSDDCDKTINHAVTIVGYGTEDGKDYWLVKNSWGTWWGDKGYIKMARGKNMCRIANWAQFPTGAYNTKK